MRKTLQFYLAALFLLASLAPAAQAANHDRRVRTKGSETAAFRRLYQLRHAAKTPGERLWVAKTLEAAREPGAVVVKRGGGVHVQGRKHHHHLTRKNGKWSYVFRGLGQSFRDPRGPHNDYEHFHRALRWADKSDWVDQAALVLPDYAASGIQHLHERAQAVLGGMAYREGRVDDAIRAFDKALLTAEGMFGAWTAGRLARAWRSKRNFRAGLSAARHAEALTSTIEFEHVRKSLLGEALFQQAVMEKNLGQFTRAASIMQRALHYRPESTATQIAVAGYQALAGRQAQSEASFNKIVDPKAGLDGVDYANNAAWYHALKGDGAAVVRYAKQALKRAEASEFFGAADQVAQYLRSETDFDRYRDQADFRALHPSLSR